MEADVATGQPKKRTFKKFSFRGVDLDALLDMSTDELVKLFSARARRRFQRGLTRKPMALIKKLRKAVFLLFYSLSLSLLVVLDIHVKPWMRTRLFTCVSNLDFYFILYSLVLCGTWFPRFTHLEEYSVLYDGIHTVQNFEFRRYLISMQSYENMNVMII